MGEVTTSSLSSPRPARRRALFLCADGGGTSCTVAIASSSGLLATGKAGPCNVKTVGPTAAVAALLDATARAWASLDPVVALEYPTRPVYTKVWLGLAGIKHQADIDAFTPYALTAFGLRAADDALAITNDGHLLASPLLSLPDLQSIVVLVAGTGSVGSTFIRSESGSLQCVAISGGWGYLLGDEGSAYAIGRLGIQYVLDNDDQAAYSSSSSDVSPSLHTDLLAHYGVPDAAALVDKTYSFHSVSRCQSFEAAEAARKIWIAEGARIIFHYAFSESGKVERRSRQVALDIVQRSVASLVQMGLRLVGRLGGEGSSSCGLSLGGSLWKVKGYRDLLLEGIRSGDVSAQFGKAIVVGESAEEGVLSLVSRWVAQSV